MSTLPEANTPSPNSEGTGHSRLWGHASGPRGPWGPAQVCCRLLGKGAAVARAPLRPQWRRTD